MRERLKLLRPGSLLVILLLGLQGCASGPPSNPDDICSIFGEQRGWHQVALKAERKWGNPMYIPMAVMHQESRFRRKARPSRHYLLGFIPWRRPSSAYGYAQVINSTWREYIDATGEYWRVRHNFADATDFVHWYLGEAMRRNGIPATDAFSLYINYHEGMTGFARSSHLEKPWLHSVAAGVQAQAQRYAQQYASCRDTLPRGFWSNLFS